MSDGTDTTKRQVYTEQFKQDIIAEVEHGKAPSAVAREHSVPPTLVYRWMKKRREQGGVLTEATPPDHVPGEEEQSTEERIAELERLLGHKEWEIARLRGEI